MKITHTYSSPNNWLEFTLSRQDYCIFVDDGEIVRDVSSTVRNNKEYLIKPNTNPFNQGS